jgi:hypothetical protein
VSVPEREEQDSPIFDSQRRRVPFDREVATTSAEQVKDHILAGCEVIAPGRRKLIALRDPPFQFECIEHICEHIHTILLS